MNIRATSRERNADPNKLNFKNKSRSTHHQTSRQPLSHVEILQASVVNQIFSNKGVRSLSKDLANYQQTQKVPKLIGRRGQIVGALDTSSIQRSSDGKFYGLFVNTKPITHDSGKQPFTTQRRSHHNAAAANELIKP